MHWMALALVSAVLLGVYDIAKKVSVRDNAVPAVLLISVSIGAAIWATLLVGQRVAPSWFPERLIVQPIDGATAGLILAKSLLVGVSWTLAFFALKHLPLSIATPIRSTSPVWTILMATIGLGERPAPAQWLGIAITLTAFWRFSLLGRREGVRFATHRAIGWMIAATLLGATSSIYDKWLLQTLSIEPATLQAWFTIGLVPVMLPMAAAWWVRERQTKRFHFRRSILWISPLLLLGDFAYFTAVADERALVSIVSVIRRCSIVVPLGYAAWVLGESNMRGKVACVGAMLVGVAILISS